MDAVFDILRFVARKMFCLIMSSTCSTVVGVVIPKGMGSTYNAANLEDPQGMLIDLVASVSLSLSQEQADRLQRAKDANQATTYNSIFYPIAKEYVATLRQSFANKRLTLLCADHKLLKYVGVKDMNYFVPSNNFLTAIVERLDEPQMKELVRRSVVDLLTDKGGRALVFSSFEELSAMLKDLGLKARI